MWLQTKIDEDGIEIIYIDEFKVSTKHNDFWGWTKQGKRGYISFDPNFFHMSFIWAVSKYKVYGVWGSEVTLCSDGVNYFIGRLIANRSADREVKDVPFVLWFDNASVHMSQQTKSSWSVPASEHFQFPLTRRDSILVKSISESLRDSYLWFKLKEGSYQKDLKILKN